VQALTRCRRRGFFEREGDDPSSVSLVWRRRKARRATGFGENRKVEIEAV
jgi:hypothetical protein